MGGLAYASVPGALMTIVVGFQHMVEQGIDFREDRFGAPSRTAQRPIANPLRHAILSKVVVVSR
jgi:hypothetical protein